MTTDLPDLGDAWIAHHTRSCVAQRARPIAPGYDEREYVIMARKRGDLVQRSIQCLGCKAVRTVETRRPFKAGRWAVESIAWYRDVLRTEVSVFDDGPNGMKETRMEHRIERVPSLSLARRRARELVAQGHRAWVRRWRGDRALYLPRTWNMIVYSSPPIRIRRAQLAETR